MLPKPRHSVVKTLINQDIKPNYPGVFDPYQFRESIYTHKLNELFRKNEAQLKTLYSKFTGEKFLEK